MALRFIPPPSHSDTFTHTPSPYNVAPSAPGLHDLLRAGVGPNPLDASQEQQQQQPISSHPLESRLKAWEATQENMRMEVLRRTYGIAEPVRRQMELKMVRTADRETRPVCLRAGSSVGGGAGLASVHEEILTGRDGIVEWEDVFTGGEGFTRVTVQDEIARKVGA